MEYNKLMKRYLTLTLLVSAVFIVGVLVLFNPVNDEHGDENQVQVREKTAESDVDKEQPEIADISNPASVHCKEQGGTLEIISNKDGSQFGMCKFKDFSCEEWVYFKNECTVEKDAEEIKQALIAKGLNLANMKVIIHKHLGKYIAGGVVPISAPGGGGYVFVVKENDEIKIVADGNGIITCSMLAAYPDYPTYLISHCVNEKGELIER